MAMHLKIGEFARLAHVSLKTLHHYDEIGLFQPAYVDRFTNYREYYIKPPQTPHDPVGVMEIQYPLR